MTIDPIGELARTIRPGERGFSEMSYHLAQITSTAGLTNQPSTITLHDGKEARIAGYPADYSTGDTVVWLYVGGAPLVIGKLANVGSERNFTAQSWEPWHVVGAAGEPAFQNSWVNFGGGYASAQFWKQTDGWVHLEGLVKNGVIGATSDIFTLPEGYRPPIDFFFTVNVSGGSGVILVQADGGVIAFFSGSNAHMSLNGISFPTNPNWSHWEHPRPVTTWTFENAVTYSEVRQYVRDDGWVWTTGALEGGASPSVMMHLADGARVGKKKVLVCGLGTGLARYRIGGYDAQGYMVQDTGGTGTNWLGGVNYYGVRGQHLTWTPYPFATGWTNFDNTGAVGEWQTGEYRKDHHGIVHLRGLIDRTAGTLTTGTLPVGFRPLAGLVANNVMFPNVQGQVEIDPAGTVRSALHPATGWLNLTGIHFRAEQ